jgi:FkbM family methyltransferase
MIRDPLRKTTTTVAMRSLAIQSLAFAAQSIHRILPVSQLRTAKLLMNLSGDGPLTLSRRLFSFKIRIRAERSTAHWLLYLMGEQFIDDLGVLERVIASRMTVIDVGANIGYVTYWLARQVGRSGCVLALEPDNENFCELASNVQENRLNWVETLQIAAGPYDGEATIAPGLNAHIIEGHGVKVAMRSLDSLLSERRISPDFVKVDVEGFEWEVLQGMRRSLGLSPPILWLELHSASSFASGSPQSVLDLLEEHYSSVVAFLPHANTHRPPWRRLLQMYSNRPLQQVSLAEVRSDPDGRYFLLCLPASGAS